METDQVRSDVGTEYAAFRKAGLDVHMDGNPGLMHHKVFIIDGQIVVMGSYNFTASAEKSNDENLIVINNARYCRGIYERISTGLCGGSAVISYNSVYEHIDFN